MFKKFKVACREFARDKPGSRFIHLHRQWSRKATGPWIRALASLGGAILIVAGILLGLIPGVPGIVLGVLGCALIAMQFRWMAEWCDRVEVWARGLFKKRRHRSAQP